MSARAKLVVIGGDAAGMSAASEAQRRRPELQIVVFERGVHTSYSACGMPYYIAGLVDDVSELIARTPDEFRQRGIDARVRHEVVSIDTDRRAVTVVDLESNREFSEPFDDLLIATGAVTAVPAIPGINAVGVHSLSVLQDGIRVRQIVDRERPRKAVVVGGGYIGIEMAEAMVLRGIDVTVVEMAPQLMGTLDEDIAEIVARAMRAAGVQVFLGESVSAVETAADGSARAVVTSERSLAADIVLLGLGVRANSTIAADAGIPLGPSGGIAVSDRLQTQMEGVWAAGDCAESFHFVSRKPVHIALGTVANKQGRICGINLGGGYARFPGVLGTAITKFGDLEIGRTGLSSRECRRYGIDFVTGAVEGTTRSGYFPQAGEITIKVIAERGSGRMLGAQIAGTQGAGKRIDVFATALAAGMTVQEFQYLDLSYAPPFSAVWDAPLIAARRAADAVHADRFESAPWPA